MRGSTTCTHEDIATEAEWNLITDEAGATIVFGLCMKVTCSTCGVPFRWQGMPPSGSPFTPGVNEDGETLRVPLEPAYVKEIMGLPAMSGCA